MWAFPSFSDICPKKSEYVFATSRLVLMSKCERLKIIPWINDENELNDGWKGEGD